MPDLLADEGDALVLPVIVVPDGLAKDARTGKTTTEPSSVYRQVLDLVHAKIGATTIYLAPANRFGGPITEQEAAWNYLSRMGRRNLVAPVYQTPPYVDTWGNAVLLRRFLERSEQWPLQPVILAVARRHSRRARFCFERNGFIISDMLTPDYDIPADAQIVSRLWYYRFPVIHRVYESLALMRDMIRPSAYIRI